MVTSQVDQMIRLQNYQCVAIDRGAVSYTHLDVYKRQAYSRVVGKLYEFVKLSLNRLIPGCLTCRYDAFER